MRHTPALLKSTMWRAASTISQYVFFFKTGLDLFKSMNRHVYSKIFAYLALVFLSIPTPSFSNELPPIFYPMQIQSQGRYLAAQKLFMGDEGGVWSLDVYGKLRFYDGENFVDIQGSAFYRQQLTYGLGSFWSYNKNKVFKHRPAQSAEVVFETEIANNITHLGYSSGWLWATDDEHIHLYSLEEKKTQQVELYKFSRFKSGGPITINDAVKVADSWYLATTSGLFIINNGELTLFDKVAPQGIETLHYSKQKRALVLGLLRGAIIYELDNDQSQHFSLNSSHVLTIAESESWIWLGTEHGLYRYHKEFRDLKQVDVDPNDEYGLTNEKIYSIATDSLGGVWLATSGGVRYYSEYSALFERWSLIESKDNYRSHAVNKIMANESGGYWLITSNALYSVNDNGVSTLVFFGQVSGLQQVGKQLWLASDRGLIVIDIGKYKVTAIKDQFPSIPDIVDHIAMSDDGELWLTSGLRLMSLELNTGKVSDYGEDWLLDKYLPAKVTSLTPSANNQLFIGTDHGLYHLNNSTIRYLKETKVYGSQINAIKVSDESIWLASSYGVAMLDIPKMKLDALPLKENNIRPFCLTQGNNHIWLTTSIGISVYNTQGSLVKHFGAPFGLINNEFLYGACAFNQRANSLILGSKYGLVESDSEALLRSDNPLESIVLTQVSVDGLPVAIGSTELSLSAFNYGSQLGFRFGVWPQFQGQSIEFRLNSQSNWIELQGTELNLDRLMPGDYFLQVRLSKAKIKTQLIELPFSVRNPWYFSSAFFLLTFFTIVLAMVAFIQWRSRRITALNRQLKLKVSLKTEQLQHQSRVLLTNNLQLRKLFNVRQSIVHDMVLQAIDHSQDFEKSATTPSTTVLPMALQNLNQNLSQLQRIVESQSSVPTFYRAEEVLKSTAEAWHAEYEVHGIRIELQLLASSDKIVLETFNLDIIFNTLLANALKRNVRGQSLVIRIEEHCGKLSIIFEDKGLPFPSINTNVQNQFHEKREKSLDFTPANLANHIRMSGGELHEVERREVNRVHMHWPLYHETATQVNFTKVTTGRDKALEASSIPLESEAHQNLKTKQEQWLRTVRGLVEEHYSDPDFTMSSVAKRLYMSERSLQRRFKAVFQKTFTDYITEFRLEKACEMLLLGDKIADVAFSCGFNDPSYFSQKFKLHFGVSPSKFAILESDLTEQQHG